MSKVLIIRLSAIGDVAIAIPLCYSLATQYPEDKFVFLSKSKLQPLFKNMPSNVTFKECDTEGRHSGWKGLVRLYSELRNDHFDKIADIHNVLRSTVLRSIFFWSGKKVAYIHKGRKQKDELTSMHFKKFVQLKHSMTRYQEVFEQLGYPVTLSFSSVIDKATVDLTPIRNLTGEKSGKWIGIAPFARHTGKIYPLEKMEQVLSALSNQQGVTVFLFGGGKKECEILNGWADKYPNTRSVAGLLIMNSELLLMSQLDVMLAMDSANMHLASLVGTPVVSIWGATHPYAGFYGINQDPANAIQIDLACRPCSIFGNKPCFRHDYACLNSISPERVIQKVMTVISAQSQQESLPRQESPTS